MTKTCMSGKVIVAAYGSLKEGFYNHPVLGEDAQLMGKTTVKGVMYLTGGGYPRLYHTERWAEEYRDSMPPIVSYCSEDKECEYGVEIYSVNMDAYESIRRMELGAGYVEEELLTEWGTAKIYYSLPDYHSEHHKYIKAYTKEVAYEG